MRPSKRQRFLQELAEHAEDAGTTEILGKECELNDIFHGYMYRSRHRLIITAVWLIALCSTLLLVLGASFEDRTPSPILASIPAPIRDLVFITGAAAYQPFLWLIAFPVSGILTRLGIDTTPFADTLAMIMFMSSPFVTALIWAAIAQGIISLYNYVYPSTTLWTSPKKS